MGRNTPYPCTRYKFFDFYKIDDRNRAFERGYLYRANISGSRFDNFVKSCIATLGNGSEIRNNSEWYCFERSNAQPKCWVQNYENKEVFFKSSDDFEQAAMHLILTDE